VAELFKNKKMLIYIGHSNGDRFIDTEFLKKNKLNMISFIMGCSSFKINNRSIQKEPLDVVSYYNSDSR